MRIRNCVAVFGLAAVVSLTASSQVASAAAPPNSNSDQAQGQIGSWLLTATSPTSPGSPTTTVVDNFAASGVVTQVTLVASSAGTLASSRQWTPAVGQPTE